MDVRELWKLAVSAREKAYAPYSGFKVGAALLLKDGTAIRGCNVENAAFGSGNCAERTAFFTAISEGNCEFEAIAIAGGKGESMEMCYPCGTCRQVMAEFCDCSTFKIVCGKHEDELEIMTLDELLPRRFEMQD